MVRHRLGDDQRVLGIHRRLYVVSRYVAASRTHEARFGLGVSRQLFKRRCNRRRVNLDLILASALSICARSRVRASRSPTLLALLTARNFDPSMATQSPRISPTESAKAIGAVPA